MPWRKTARPVVYISHQTNCPAYDDADARVAVIRRFDGATGTRLDESRPTDLGRLLHPNHQLSGPIANRRR